MSRSYKKTPYWGDKNDMAYKKIINKKLRKTKNIADGKEFKKYTCSWFIKDYYTIMTLKEWLERYGDDYASEDDAIKEYNKFYKRK